MNKQDLATQTVTDAHGTDLAAPYPFIPPADVLEDRAGITIHLDMPGVTKEGLSIEVDKNTLVIEGKVQIERRTRCGEHGRHSEPRRIVCDYSVESRAAATKG